MNLLLKKVLFAFYLGLNWEHTLVRSKTLNIGLADSISHANTLFIYLSTNIYWVCTIGVVLELQQHLYLSRAYILEGNNDCLLLSVDKIFCTSLTTLAKYQVESTNILALASGFHNLVLWSQLQKEGMTYGFFSETPHSFLSAISSPGPVNVPWDRKIANDFWSRTIADDFHHCFLCLLSLKSYDSRTHFKSKSLEFILCSLI